MDVWMNLCKNILLNESNERMYNQLYERKTVWFYEYLNWMNELPNYWITEWMNLVISGWIKYWINKWINKWKEDWLDN